MKVSDWLNRGDEGARGGIKGDFQVFSLVLSVAERMQEEKQLWGEKYVQFFNMMSLRYLRVTSR